VHHPEKRSPCDIGHTPKMQDAIFGGCESAPHPEKRNARRKCRSNFRRVRVSAPSRKTKPLRYRPYAENAGAISGGCVSVHHPEKRSPCDIGHTPKMQDAIFGGCMAAHYPEKRRASALDRAGTPISTSNFRRLRVYALSAKRNAHRKCRTLFRRVCICPRSRKRSAKALAKNADCTFQRVSICPVSRKTKR